MKRLIVMGLLGCGTVKQAAHTSTPSAPPSDSGSETETETETEIETEPDHGPCLPNWDGWADGFFATWCRSCHSVHTPDRRGAPEGIDLNTEAEAIALRHRIQARVVDDATMPVGGGVPPDELRILEDWLTCAELASY